MWNLLYITQSFFGVYKEEYPLRGTDQENIVKMEVLLAFAAQPIAILHPLVRPNWFYHKNTKKFLY